MASTFPATADLPQTGLVTIRYLLDEASGNAIANTGGLNLTDNNSVGAGTGLILPGVNFDNSRDFERGSSMSFSHADNALFDITGDLTISDWLKIESNPGNNEVYVIVAKTEGTGNQQGYKFDYRDISGTKRLFIEISSDGSTQTTKFVDQILTVGTWFHVAVVYDASAGEADFYVNGVAVGSTQTGLPTSIFNNTANFNIGAQGNTPQNFMDGLMQDNIIWDGAELTAAEVLTLYELYTISSQTSGAPLFFQH